MKVNLARPFDVYNKLIELGYNNKEISEMAGITSRTLCYLKVGHVVTFRTYEKLFNVLYEKALEKSSVYALSIADFILKHENKKNIVTDENAKIFNNLITEYKKARTIVEDIERTPMSFKNEEKRKKENTTVEEKKHPNKKKKEKVVETEMVDVVTVKKEPETKEEQKTTTSSNTERTYKKVSTFVAPPGDEEMEKSPLYKEYLEVGLMRYCKNHNLHYDTIRSRFLKLNWSFKKAIETPLRKYKRL